MTLDPTNYAIISQSLIAAAHEMGSKLIRSGYSTILREAKDGSTGILDRKGQVIAQSDFIPMHLGSMAAVLAPCLERHPVETLQPGDFLINNDPFSGGQHLQDIFIFSPVFFEGALVGFVASVAHHVDIGGAEGGLNMGATEVFQEGLRIPPSLYSGPQDWNGGSFQRLVAANCRAPDQTIGDLNAQFAANAIGSRRLQQLCRKYGAGPVLATMEELLDYSERRIRKAIAAMPDGTYSANDWLDDDGNGSGPLEIRVALRIEGDSIDIDFEGSCGQVRGNINCPFSSTVSAAICCAKAVLTSPDIPLNSGVSRVFSIKAPPGSILNPLPPAAVRARTMAANRAWSAVMKALAQVVPHNVIAGGGDTTTAFALSFTDGDRFSTYIEPLGGGFGAYHNMDGCDAVDAALSNCANTPIEATDATYDFFRLRSYRLEKDSFGDGQFRGGAGFSRSFEILRDGVTLGIYSDHHKLSPQGLEGGLPGKPGFCRVKRGEEVIPIPSKSSFTLKRGDLIEIGFPGGAGYGDPARRNPASRQRDIDNGLLTTA